MKSNTILVQFDIDAVVGPLLRIALILAEKLDAEVIGFAAAEARFIVPGDMAGPICEEPTWAQLGSIDTRLKELESEFRQYCSDCRHATWHSVIGNPTNSLALLARSADLVLTRSVRPGIGLGTHRTVDHGRLILSAGRPVLIASRSLIAIEADHVLVAWKDTREARRVLSDAIPFLARAKSVLLVTVVEDEERNHRASLADVASFLVRYGVKARLEVIDETGSDTGEILIHLANQLGADLIVSGGYGHSRIREWALGGVTRSLLEKCAVNWLVAN